jgi:hypothetical protein
MANLRAGRWTSLQAKPDCCPPVWAGEVSVSDGGSLWPTGRDRMGGPCESQLLAASKSAGDLQAEVG